MKVTISEHPDFVRLVTYFQKIESIAAKMGVDVDDLISERRNRHSSMYTSFKKNILNIAQKRADTFVKRDNDSSSENSFAGLTILFGEKK